MIKNLEILSEVIEEVKPELPKEASHTSLVEKEEPEVFVIEAPVAENVQFSMPKYPDYESTENQKLIKMMQTMVRSKQSKKISEKTEKSFSVRVKYTGTDI